MSAVTTHVAGCARRFGGALIALALALTGCNGASSSSSALPPSQSGTARVRFADGAPSLKTLINGYPQDIGVAYLQVNGATVVSSFTYGTTTSFGNVTAGTLSLVARDTLGYAVGPLKTPALTAGKRYTLVIVGSYPRYSVLSFEEPPAGGNAALSLYEASPSVRHAAFGRFQASTHSHFKQLGSANFASVATAALGSTVSDFGGYVGTIGSPIGTVTPAQIDPFDRHNALPFHAIKRLSLFLFDAKPGTAIGPVFGSLDE